MDVGGIKVAKWTKITVENETLTAAVVNRTDGIKALAVQGVTSESNEGSTLQFSDTVDTLGISFPAVAGNNISEFLIQCPEEQEVDYRLLISMDGVNFITLKPSGHLAWTPKGPIQQITIKSNTNAGVAFELVMNLGAN